jgi:hypothetical protein
MRHSVLPIPQTFMPATHSLAFGILKAAITDLWELLKRFGMALMEVWLDGIYTLSVFLQRRFN